MLSIDGVEVGTLLQNDRPIEINDDNNIYIKGKHSNHINTIFTAPSTQNIQIFVRSTSAQFDSTVQSKVGVEVELSGDYVVASCYLKDVRITKRSGDDGWTYWKAEVLPC
jgi:hypothetical protein